VNRKTILRIGLVAAALVIVFAGGYIAYNYILPALFTPPGPTGVPTAQSGGLRATLTERANLTATARTSTPTLSGTQASGNGILSVAYQPNPRPQIDAQTSLYTSCLTVRGSTPTPSAAGPAPTAAATSEAQPTQASTPSTPGDVVIYRIVKEESEACFQVGEVLRGAFNLVVGVSKEMDGEVAIDRTNVANTLLGDEIVVNIAQLTTDDPMRNNWFRSERGFNFNKYPTAKLTQTTLLDLPSTPYKDGDVLNFHIAGKLQVREATRDVVFTATAVLKDGTLVVTAYSDIKLTDFGMTPPDLGMVKANDEVRIVLNLVLRESKS